MRADPARVAEGLVPVKPRLGGVVLLRVGEERRVLALRVAVHRCTRPDAWEELRRGLILRRDGHREVERGFDGASGSGCEVPGVKADVRGKACVGLDGRRESSLVGGCARGSAGLRSSPLGCSTGSDMAASAPPPKAGQ